MAWTTVTAGTLTVSSGAQSASTSQEFICGSIAVAETLVAYIDCINMAAGDAVEIRAKARVNATSASGVTRTVYMGVFQNVQDEPVKCIEWACPSSGGASLTIKQFSGSQRVYDWRILYR